MLCVCDSSASILEQGRPAEQEPTIRNRMRTRIYMTFHDRSIDLETEKEEEEEAMEVGFKESKRDRER